MAARAIWSGSITFGLVNVPIKLYPAVKDKDVHFHLLSKDGQCRLRRKLVCPETGDEYDFKDTAKGYEIAPEQYVIINEEELKSLKPEAGRNLEIIDFVDLAEIDPIYYNRPYYLAPDSDDTDAYQLLLKVMTETQKVGIAKFVMHGKEYLAAIRPLKGALCLETMNFADEVVPVGKIPNLPVDIHASRKELDVARRLVDVLATEFKPTKYHEEYREKVLELIDKKAAGEDIVTHAEPEEEEPARILNLMKALEESLQKARRTTHHGRKKSA
jgi:DNA end-binding protein Ku